MIIPGMRHCKKCHLGALIIILSLVIAAAVAVVSHWGAERRAARRDLERLESLLELGDSRDLVETRIFEAHSPYLKMSRLSPERWLVETPTEFGARNWYLVMEFDGNWKLAAIGYRCEDSLRMHPAICRPDRVSADVSGAWERDVGITSESETK
jgi:hypothetical protein